MTSAEIAQRQAEIEARLAAATPGEWGTTETFPIEKGFEPSPSDDFYDVQSDTAGDIAGMLSKADAEFIANAPKDMRWQRERIKALETELEEVEEKYRSLLKCARCCANCIHFSCGLDAYPCCECLGNRDETKRYSHWELYVSSEEETGKGDA